MRGSKAKSIRNRNIMKHVVYVERNKHQKVVGMQPAPNGKTMPILAEVSTRELEPTCGRGLYKRFKRSAKRV